MKTLVLRVLCVLLIPLSLITPQGVSTSEAKSVALPARWQDHNSSFEAFSPRLLYSIAPYAQRLAATQDRTLEDTRLGADSKGDQFLSHLAGMLVDEPHPIAITAGTPSLLAAVLAKQIYGFFTKRLGTEAKQAYKHILNRAKSGDKGLSMPLQIQLVQGLEHWLQLQEMTPELLPMAYFLNTLARLRLRRTSKYVYRSSETALKIAKVFLSQNDKGRPAVRMRDSEIGKNKLMSVTYTLSTQQKVVLEMELTSHPAAFENEDDHIRALNIPLGKKNGASSWGVMVQSRLLKGDNQEIDFLATVEHEVREVLLRALGYSVHEAHRLATEHMERGDVPISAYLKSDFPRPPYPLENTRLGASHQHRKSMDGTTPHSRRKQMTSVKIDARAALENQLLLKLASPSRTADQVAELVLFYLSEGRISDAVSVMELHRDVPGVSDQLVHFLASLQEPSRLDFWPRLPTVPETKIKESNLSRSSVSETMSMMDILEHHSWLYRHERSYLKKLLNHIHELKPKDILVVGHAVTYLAPALRIMGFNVLSVNPSTLMPELLGEGKTLKHALDEIDLARFRGAFDLILLPDAIGEWLGKDPRKAISNLYHLTRPNAYVAMPQYALRLGDELNYMKSVFLDMFSGSLRATERTFKTFLTKDRWFFRTNRFYQIQKPVRNTETGA